MRIEITMEKTTRVAMEIEATEEQIEALRNGKNPFYEQMEKEIKAGAGNIEYNYAVNDLGGNEIIPWS